MSTTLIGLDWGSTHLRAYRFGEDGVIEETRVFASGIRQLPAGGYVDAFIAAVDGWPNAPVMACGMVGSRDGWKEVPYLDVPANVVQLAHSLSSVDGPRNYRLHLIAGLHDKERPDVMRGEETQIVGALGLQENDAWTGTMLLPGTHSKWAEVRDGLVMRFATVMTGELYGVLGRHSVLGASTAEHPVDDAAAFHRGVQASRDSGSAGGLSCLFSTRALMLDGVLPPASIPDYLSGLLIGDEFRIALAAGWVSQSTPILMIGESSLCERYERAAGCFGLGITRAPDNTTAFGLWRIAVAAGLITNRFQHA